MLPGKLTAVSCVSCTAFQPAFVNITDCALFGRMPSDQADESSQSPLDGLIQLFVWAVWPKTGSRERKNVRNRQQGKVSQTFAGFIVMISGTSIKMLMKVHRATRVKAGVDPVRFSPWWGQGR